VNVEQTKPRFQPFARRVIALAGLCLLTAIPTLGTAEPPHVFVVLREHGSGAATRAQPYLDQLLDAVAKKTGWSSASGKYFAERAPALEFMRSKQPQFGILSLDAYLALKASHELSVIGEVVAPKAGGLQYHLVSTKAKDLAGCRGQQLATTFVADPAFIERVVARGAFKLSEFKVVAAQRPVQPLKQVLRGEAACALIDDAQLDAAKHIEEGGKLKSVWQSTKLPGMAVVAFPKTDKASVAQFKASLASLCAAAGQACSSVGIEQLRPTTEATYRPVIAAYTK
jgi:hypothetical protein